MICGQGGLYRLRRGGIKFGGLGLQYQTNGYSVKNILEGSFTEEVTGTGNAIFEGGLKFEASEARKKLDITDSADQVAIGEVLGRDRGVSDQKSTVKNE